MPKNTITKQNLFTQLNILTYRIITGYKQQNTIKNIIVSNIALQQIALQQFKLFILQTESTRPVPGVLHEGKPKIPVVSSRDNIYTIFKNWHNYCL